MGEHHQPGLQHCYPKVVCLPVPVLALVVVLTVRQMPKAGQLVPLVPVAVVVLSVVPVVVGAASAVLAVGVQVPVLWAMFRPCT